MKPPSTKRALLAAGALTATMLAAPAASLSRHVVLVPGIWDTAWAMRRMDARLRAAGFHPVLVVLQPNDGRLPLDALAAQIHAAVDQHIPARERFSLVGFSMGGLVARSYLRQFGDPPRIDTFISISSPHRGTLTAWLSGAPGVRDMRPGSAFLAALDADAPRFHATRWITIRTPLDLIIVPSSSSTLAWARNASTFVLVHPLMLWDGRVITRVIHELNGATPQ